MTVSSVKQTKNDKFHEADDKFHEAVDESHVADDKFHEADDKFRVADDKLHVADDKLHVIGRMLVLDRLLRERSITALESSTHFLYSKR